MVAYHDTEWGVPVSDDRLHFEFLVLDTFQAGLSWAVILHRREAFRQAFKNFYPHIVSSFDNDRMNRLMNNVSIVRNRAKIEATVSNAARFLEVQSEFGTFDAFIWSFTEGRTIRNRWPDTGDVPAFTRESERMSEALRRRGFRFVGPTVCYAYMQGAGIVNDHVTSCFRHEEVSRLARR
ncbi:DNA-3-methyladenine glycosylase I [Candidatus Palauibacter sp.]|uniref:DNA-3-methyladenine glycosylase I n=1 Tax=Candidatus Palauibacter sp. TaxID=3101350 RepID=UPI003B026219